MCLNSKGANMKIEKEFSVAVVKTYMAQPSICHDREITGEYVKEVLKDPNVKAIMIVKIP